MATNETLITQEGLQQLKDELNELKSVRRIKVSKRIQEAIALGDLSENSEYDDAKNEQAFIEGRIAELEGKIRTAKIIQESDDSSAKVRLGSKVILEDVETGDRFDYTVVGTAEADPFNNRISNESPVGKAILGQTINADNPTVVTVKAPAGELKYRILPPDAE
ncbi:transcription elongation factor GreA [uncultured Megasphaera sp.]|uniref:transcription elongation factor GreA n=1 Tax=uncultured Megasphaera sp. TaxID=165188 RepID=UPI0026596607|nr:transcription elongation factor GreA [uncultured Megasphaera sp.]